MGEMNEPAIYGQFDVMSIVWPAITATITQFINWLYIKRKDKIQTKSNELDNIDRAIEIWRKNSENLRVEMEKERNECTRRLEDMQMQIDTLKKFLKEMSSKSNTNEELQYLFDRWAENRNK